jgi:hypothetical protein
LLDKLSRNFGRDQLFCFEMAITMLTNYFYEWLSEAPGPPPDVLSRIDAIMANYDPDLRDALGSGLVGWSAYRTLFAEVTYDRSWLEIMDVMLSSSPQFVDYLVAAWIVLNGRQLRYDAGTFHACQRPVICEDLVKLAIKIERSTIESLKILRVFRPLVPGEYPMIEAGHDSVVLRTLQGDYDQLAEMQKRLAEEKKKADDADRTKQRRQQTYDSISDLHAAKEKAEKIETARAVADIDYQMRKLRLEGKRLRQNEERAFIESWKREWDTGVDLSMTSVPKASGTAAVDMVNDEDVRIQSYVNLRQADLIARDSRKIIASRGRRARLDIEQQMHDTDLKNQVRAIAANPALLLRTAPMRSPKSRK